MNYPVFKARLVMGSLFDINTKTHEQKPEPDENKHNWFVGFAVPKGPQWDAIYNHMVAVASSDPTCTAALCNQPGFNWKIEDCDAPSDPSKLGSQSYPAGHMLIKFNRYRAMGPIPLIDGNAQPILNSSAVKRGDYFHISASCKFNGAATVKTNAGMYQNIEGVMFAEVGEAIISEGSFDAATAFAGVQGGTVVNGATPQVGAPVAAAPVVAATVTPATDLVTPGATIAPPPVPAPPVPAPEVKYNHEGTVYTKSQLEGFGFLEVHFASMTPVA